MCKIDMVLGNTDANRIRLQAEKLVVEEEADMNLFFITEHRLVNINQPKEGIVRTDRTKTMST